MNQKRPTGSAQSVVKGSSSPRAVGKRKHSLAYGIVLWTITGFASLFLLMVLAFAALYLMIDIPQANAQARQEVSVVYYADGKTEMGRFTTTNREPVELKQVPVSVQRAFLAAEDRTFYSNRGISPTGIARAFYNNFTGKGSGSQGGSTITQQYVKNYFLSQDKTVTRKVKEVIISLKIDQEHSKDQILQDYLNNVYFGRGTYGIQAASKSYFHKDASQLTTVEGAFLASVVNNPENMDPTVGPNSNKRANARMAYVLNGMMQEGWLSADERNKAVMPKFYPRQPIKYADGPEGYVVQSVRAELARKLKLSQEDIDRGGLRITTTIDKATEDKAIAAVNEVVGVKNIDGLRTGLVATKPNDGAIVAMYGGKDYDPVKSGFNAADQAMLQSASEMKLFTTIAALQKGQSIVTEYDGNSPLRMGPTTVTNDGDESWGRQPLYSMLAHSINTAYVTLNDKIGPQATLDAAKASGFPQSVIDTYEVNPINTLGTGDARVVDMATAYNTLNSGGQFYDRYLISHVKTFDGSFSYDVQIEPKRAYPKGIADDVTWALNKVTTQGTAAGLQNAMGRPVAGKTGTATGNKYIWFTGFAPGQLTTSVAIYYSPDGATSQSMQNLGLSTAEIYGAGLPTMVWAKFMEAALQGQPVNQLPERSYYNMAKPEQTYAPAPVPTMTRVPQAPGTVNGGQVPVPPTRRVSPTATDAPQQPQPSTAAPSQTIPTAPTTSSPPAPTPTSTPPVNPQPASPSPAPAG